jgi:hypothetical protein
MTRFRSLLVVLFIALILTPAVSAAPPDRDAGAESWLTPLRQAVEWAMEGLEALLPSMETPQPSKSSAPPEGGGDEDEAQTVDPNHGAMIIVTG